MWNQKPLAGLWWDWGAVVSLIGQMSRPGELGAGILGFGLAHIVLGILDMLRPTVRQRS